MTEPNRPDGAQPDARPGRIDELPPPPMSAALDAELASLRPVRLRRPVRDAAVLFLAGLLLAGGMLAMMDVREDLPELPLPWLVLMSAAWLLGFVVPAWLALVPPRGQVIARWRAAAAAGGTSAVLFVVSGFALHPSGPSSIAHLEEPMHSYGCFEVGLVASLLPAILAATLVRGAFPVGSRWAAAAIGASSGALGGMMLHFHCSVTDPVHVGVMHGGVVVAAALLSALVAPSAVDRAFR